MKIAVYGAGEYGRYSLIRLYGDGVAPCALFDSDKAKHGTTVMGFEVKAPETLARGGDGPFVVVSVLKESHYAEIKERLENLGLRESKDFMHCHDFFGEDFENSLCAWGRSSGYEARLRDESGAEFSRIRGVADCRILISETAKSIYRVSKGHSKKTMREVYGKLKGSGLLGKYIVGTSEGLDGKFAGSHIELEDAYILKHSFVEPIVFALEFPPLMFLECAKFVIDLVRRLDACGMGIVDIFPANVVFSGGRFLLIDFGGITDAKTPSYVFQQFMHGYINPLILMSKKQEDRAYMYLKAMHPHPAFSDIRGYLSGEEIERYQTMAELCESALISGDTASACDQLAGYAGGIQIKKEELTWNNTQNRLWVNWHDKENWADKAKIIESWVKSKNIQTLIDMAGNQGFYPVILADSLKYAISVDFDGKLADDLYLRICRNNISNVYPVFMNIIAPTLPKHKNHFIDGQSIRPWIKGAKQRFKCDCVLGCAIMHHLIFRESLDFSDIISLLAEFTDQYLIIEYIQKNDYALPLSEDFYWYTQENFERELSARSFSVIDKRVSDPERQRILYFCERRAVE
jgi:hypothetical protein